MERQVAEIRHTLRPQGRFRQGAMKLKPRLGRTAMGLAVGITAAVAVASAAGAYFYSVHHFKALLDGERRTALVQGEMMRAALEHQMIENDRSLIAQLVESFGREPRVARVMLLDRTGTVRYTSAPVESPAEFRLESPTCQACHTLPPEQRGSSRVIDTRGGTMLRTVIPFRNREACHTCHDPAHRINGIMILDVDAGELRASMNSDLLWMVAVSGGIALVLIVALALIVRVVVLRRLQRFETTARLIAAGDLATRVPTGGSDTISWLAAEFNTMADSMTGLVSDVRTERERLETVINSIDDGIVVLDTRRKVLAANDAFLQRSARSREQAVGCFCRDIAQGICTAHDCPTLACLQSGARQVRICERHAADGSLRSEEVHASPVRDADGRLIQIVEVWRDISDRRAAEARLAESHRLASLGLLASGFSHELNTPLATVLMCVEGILRDAGGDRASVDEHASIARDQILRCRGITQQFLRMARGQPSAVDIVDVRSVVNAAVRLVDPTARAQGVRIEVDEADARTAARVSADGAELQHAVINLLINAVQASRQGGRVAVAVQGGDRIRIRIADQGCGIASADQQRIFEPFFSLRNGGTGLGLFLSLNFIRQSGGDIQLQSAVDAGSTFEIVLPPVDAGDAAIEYRPAS